MAAGKTSSPRRRSTAWAPATPGARAHYDHRKDAGDRHAAAQRNLFSRLLGCLHHCLATGQHYNETVAFPAKTTPCPPPPDNKFTTAT
jgi:hypothetical protein